MSQEEDNIWLEKYLSRKPSTIEQAHFEMCKIVMEKIVEYQNDRSINRFEIMEIE